MGNRKKSARSVSMANDDDTRTKEFIMKDEVVNKKLIRKKSLARKIIEQKKS